MSDITCPCGCNGTLTLQQARTVVARYKSAMRRTHSGGRNGGSKPTCTCGVCAKCKARAYQQKWRAGRGK